MVLLKIKTFFGKILLFFKSYWSYIALGLSLLVVGFGIFNAKKKSDLYNKLWDDYMKQASDYRKQYRELSAVYETAMRKNEQIEIQYRETIARIERDHQEALKALDNTKKRELREIISTTQDNPEEMANRINTLFGIPVQQ